MLPVLGSARHELRGTDVAAVTQHTVFVPAEILYISMSNVRMKGGGEGWGLHESRHHPHCAQTAAKSLGFLCGIQQPMTKRPCLPRALLTPQVHEALVLRGRRRTEDEGNSNAQSQTKEALDCFNRLTDQWSIKV